MPLEFISPHPCKTKTEKEGPPATHHYGAVYRQLRQQGTAIPTNDMWIAALVLQHSLVVFARDTHFDALPQLPRA